MQTIKPIVTVGDALAEIMRPGRDQSLETDGEFRGPFPSGAAGIFADAVGRLGVPCVFIGAVGDDAFGRCITDRLARDGVDVSGMRVVKDRATGVAFVTYRSDGSRQFVYHAAYAAAGQVDPSLVKSEVIQSASWLAISGTSLTIGESCRAAALYAIDLAMEAGVPISFDPNIRAEMIGGQAKAREICDPVLRVAKVIAPTLTEARGLTGRNDPNEVARVFLDMGIQQVVLKRGEQGCSIYTPDGKTDIASFPVEEVDPTGAGDCFLAGYLVGLTRGMTLTEAGRYANAVGALSVTRLGPMEGCPTDADVQALLRS